MTTQVGKCPLPSFLHPRAAGTHETERNEPGLVSRKQQPLAVQHARMPQAHGYPLLGVLPQLASRGLDYLCEARARYGDVYSANVGPMKVIALNHPRHAQRVLIDNVRNYTKGGALWETSRTLLGNGLPNSEGAFWLRQRRLMQPQFHPARLAAMAAMMSEVIDQELDSWAGAADSGAPMDVASAMTRITMKIIVKTMFGAGLSHEQVERVSKAFTYALGYMVRGTLTAGLPKWVPVPGRRRFHEAIRLIDRTIDEVIAQHRADDAASSNLLSLLLDRVDGESGEQMTRAQLRDEVISLFLAGYETTSNALAWTFHFMLQQPELGRRLDAELDAFGGRMPGFEELELLPWTRWLLQESMRLYPPAYWIPRTAVEDDEIDGYRIPAGSMVAIATYAIHRHPGLWEAPERFDPERFSPERSAGRAALAWMPFGAGQRLCIGKGFALMEGQLILARAFQRYCFEAVPGHMAQPHVAIILRPRDGVWARVSRRSHDGRGA